MSNSSSTSIIAVRSWCRASWFISPCIRAWAPKRGGLAGIWETLRMLRRSGLIDTDLGHLAPKDPGYRTRPPNADTAEVRPEARRSTNSNRQSIGFDFYEPPSLDKRYLKMISMRSRVK